MNWDLFMILMTVVASIALIFFGTYKITKMCFMHKQQKENEKSNVKIIEEMEKIYTSINQSNKNNREVK